MISDADSLQTSALNKSFTYLLTYLFTYLVALWAPFERLVEVGWTGRVVPDYVDT